MHVLFNRLGYDGVYSKRTFDRNDEGCATFYNTSKFTLKDNVAYRLGEIAFKVHTYFYKRYLKSVSYILAY